MTQASADAAPIDSTAASEAPPLARPHAWSVAIVATLVMSVSYIDRQALAAIAPTVRAALSIDHEQFGLLLSAFSMAYLVGAPIAGVVVDRIGARRGLAVALLVWSAVAGLHALVASFAMLFVLRIALGFAEAPSFPGAAQTVRRVLGPGDRSAGFGVLFTGSSIGAMIAGPLAITLNTRFEWRGAFLGTALVGLAWLPLWLTVTHASRVRARMSRATQDAPASMAALLGVLKTAPVQRAVLLVVMSSPSIMFVLLWMPQFLVDAHALTQRDLTQYVWLPPLFFDGGAILFGTLASRRDRRARGALLTHWPLLVAAALLSSALAFVPLAHTPWHAVILASVSLAGGGAVFALLTGDMLARVSPSHASSAGGITAAAQSFAYVVANPIVGRVVKTTHSYDSILVALGALVLPGAIAWALWRVPQLSLPPPSPAPSAIGE